MKPPHPPKLDKAQIIAAFKLRYRETDSDIGKRTLLTYALADPVLRSFANTLQKKLNGRL